MHSQAKIHGEFVEELETFDYDRLELLAKLEQARLANLGALIVRYGSLADEARDARASTPLGQDPESASGGNRG